MQSKEITSKRRTKRKALSETQPTNANPPIQLNSSNSKTISNEQNNNSKGNDLLDLFSQPTKQNEHIMNCKYTHSEEQPQLFTLYIKTIKNKEFQKPVESTVLPDFPSQFVVKRRETFND